MTCPSAPRIGIIGGGPGGLTLLNVLARHGVAGTLYERDDSAAARAHLGRTLDLHEESGQAAMRGAGLFEEFERVSRPEIDRRDLRQILVDGAPTESIKWGHAFVSARQLEGSHEWEVTFSNGARVTVDQLVGADGARSRVRPLVSPVQPIYTGLQILELSFLAAEHPELSARCGAGSVFGYDEGKMLGVQVNGDGRIHVYGFVPLPEDFRLPAPLCSSNLSDGRHGSAVCWRLRTSAPSTSAGCTSSPRATAGHTVAASRCSGTR